MNVTVKTFFFDFYSFDVKRLNNVIVLFKFFFRSYLFIPKCNNNTIDGRHLAQHEELLKP